MRGIDTLEGMRKLAEEVDSNWEVVQAKLERIRDLMVDRRNLIVNLSAEDKGFSGRCRVCSCAGYACSGVCGRWVLGVCARWVLGVCGCWVLGVGCVGASGVCRCVGGERAMCLPERGHGARSAAKGWLAAAASGVWLLPGGRIAACG